jgi:hypothetical protein
VAAGRLYAKDHSGRLWHRATTRAASTWTQGPQADPNINALATHDGRLYATTTTGRLLRTARNDFASWSDVFHCNFAVGLGAIENMLFVSTTENKLWWLDLASPRAFLG